MEKEQYIWKPYATQDFKVDTSLSGPAATFNKNGGFSCFVDAGLSLTVTDAGTTAWGKQLIQQQNPPHKSTGIMLSNAMSSLTMVSAGKLVLGETTVTTHISLLDSQNLQLFVREVFFSNTHMQIFGGSLEMLGPNFSYLKIDNAVITVEDNGGCHITPSFGEQKIDIAKNFYLMVTDTSSAQLDGVSVQPGASVQFNLQTIGEPDTPTVRLSGIDFLGEESQNYPKGMFNFTTYDGKNNRGNFVLAGIGNAIQFNYMLQLELVAIDGNSDRSYVNSRIDNQNIYQNGDMIVRLRFQK
ncbi:hypothetical protein [Phyllobacterium leguminum]|uniref:Uncharacterized protein n=1 Tax=Phyllobacterium leguminum TaxID=314237 RepID=A0A318T6A9_9HYPH|nr:hypothetical protein [Phyllobacterium leguminum]PYE89924.1 hypothetical protein C7477_10210 [Phyllobacterium leguminum]